MIILHSHANRTRTTWISLQPPLFWPLFFHHLLPDPTPVILMVSADEELNNLYEWEGGPRKLMRLISISVLWIHDAPRLLISFILRARGKRREEDERKGNAPLNTLVWDQRGRITLWQSCLRCPGRIPQSHSPLLAPGLPRFQSH